MNDVQTALERLAPLPEARLHDWSDVLRRARDGRRRRSALLAAAVIAAALLIAGPALGIRPAVFGDEPTPTWTWPEGLPGEPVAPPTIIRDGTDAFRRLVDRGSLRLIATAGAGREREEFLAARGADGDICLTKIGAAGLMASEFTCLHDPPKAGAQPLDQQAVLIGNEAGGRRGSVVDYSTLIGVARADVGRVELELVNGQTIELPLNRWRGFGYYATDPQHFPKTLSVYATWSSFFRRHEKLVGQLPLQEVGGLAPTPLCGGSAGPCPEGVKP